MRSEAQIQDELTLAAAYRGERLWRNNSGAGEIKASGSYVRWGLGNISRTVNERFKSADLVGLRSVVITPDMVGRTIGMFYARECKAEGWEYTGTPDEQAQARWLLLVKNMGGDAAFHNGVDLPVPSVL